MAAASTRVHPNSAREPALPLSDPRVVSMLTAEYSSLQSTRSLVYNEAFTRGAMFLSFVSMSLVGLALIAQTLAPGSSPLAVAIVVLALDLVVGLTTYGRIIRANYEDYLAIQAMARIRYAYAEIAPVALPYLSGGVSDDMAGVMATYGSPPVRGLAALAYQLTTSSTLVALVDAVLAAVLALAVGIALGASVVTSTLMAALVGVVVLVAIAALTARFYLGVQRSIEVQFPAARSTGAAPRR